MRIGWLMGILGGRVGTDAGIIGSFRAFQTLAKLPPAPHNTTAISIRLSPKKECLPPRSATAGKYEKMADRPWRPRNEPRGDGILPKAILESRLRTGQCQLLPLSHHRRTDRVADSGKEAAFRVLRLRRQDHGKHLGIRIDPA